MTDRFALTYAETLGSRSLVARIKPESVEAVKAAADILDVVGARTQLRKAGARYTGRCPFHEERTPSFSVNAVDKLYYCFGCGAGGDVISFVKETENTRLLRRDRVARRPVPGRARVRGELARAPTAPVNAASGSASCSSRPRPSTSAASGRRTAARRPATYLAGRGLGEEICRAFRLGFAPGGQTLARKALEQRLHARTSSLTAGLVNRRGNDYFSQRIVFPLADARGRVLGFQARKLREDDPLQAKYVNSPESDLFRKGDVLYGLDLARAAIAKQDRAIVVEGNTDVIALRQEGLEPVVAAMGTALTDRHLRQLSRLSTQPLALLRRRRGRRGGDAARHGAGGRARVRDQGRHAAAGQPTRPSSRRASSSGSRAAEPYLVYRVRVEIDRAADRQEAYVRVREILGRLRRVARPAGSVAARRRPARLPVQTPGRPRLADAGGTGDASRRRLLEAGDRLERDTLAGCLAHPQLVPVLAASSAGASSTPSATARLRAAPRRRRRADPRPAAADRRAGRARRVARRSTSATAKELLLRLTRAGPAPASSPGRTATSRGR